MKQVKSLEENQSQQIQKYFLDKYNISISPDDLPEVRASLIHLGRALFLNYSNLDKEAYEE
jgi:hypothetical protein